MSFLKSSFAKIIPDIYCNMDVTSYLQCSIMCNVRRVDISIKGISSFWSRRTSSSISVRVQYFVTSFLCYALVSHPTLTMLGSCTLYTAEPESIFVFHQHISRKHSLNLYQIRVLLFSIFVNLDIILNALLLYHNYFHSYL